MINQKRICSIWQGTKSKLKSSNLGDQAVNRIFADQSHFIHHGQTRTICEEVYKAIAKKFKIPDHHQEDFITSMDLYRRNNDDLKAGRGNRNQPTQ